MKTVEVFAPAKINLTLHVTGRRDDGYHLLDSLVTFAPVGDRLTIRDGNVLSLTVEGPEAGDVPADMDNIALRAAMFAAQGRGAALVLHKHLPIASGIGGGSADAAAAFRGMLCFGEEGDAPADGIWAMPDVVFETHARALLELGADVPMCLWPRPLRARGIGEKIDPIRLPSVPAVLVNPRAKVSTPEVFKALSSKANPPMPEALPEMPSVGDLIHFLSICRNDLEETAITLVPSIGILLERIGALKGCRLARMSGSGGTCFGLFDDLEAAKSSVETLRQERPDWWVAGGVLGDQSERAMPVRY